MLFHASIPADAPAHVASVIAELWRGEVLPFPPFPGAYMAWLGDERRTVLEVYPRGREHIPAPGEFGVWINPRPSMHSEVHLAIGTVLSADEVLAIAKREAWTAQRSERGGLFTVIEFWVENKFLLELLTDEERQRYLKNLTLGNYRAALGLA